MIPLEIVFQLLDQLRADTLELVENPDGRDAFAFGELTGRLRSVAEMRERLNSFVEQNQRGFEDHG